jgi:hypothetical protein
MSSDRVAALFIVGRHSFIGTVDHSGSRVLDVLNEASTEFLRVQGVSVFRGLEGGPIAHYDEITVPKAAIDCVILTDERHEAPLRRKYALVEKQSHNVFVLLTDYEVRGTVMLGRSLDPVLILNSGASSFFAVVGASVSSVDGKGPPVPTKVAFVNKSKVSLLQIEKQETLRSTAN